MPKKKAKKEEEKKPEEAKPTEAKPAEAGAGAPAPGKPGAALAAAEGAAEAPKKEEKKKKEKKSQKDRPRSKTKHKKIQVWKLYEVKDGKVTRKNEKCPRCGPGTFLASYKNRKFCGKCGFGVIKGQEKTEPEKTEKKS